ncbi:MAG TPA: FMN-binding negative transcriptional regulator [Acidimicrobiales bacterium]|nr:FMN-binding negative transcriptional regulator [Acidimicrobiales bacterium]
MFVAPADATFGEEEWRPFVEAHPFGHLVAPGGAQRDLPVVVPTQFVLDGSTVWLHLVRANPVFGALAEDPRVLLSVADDWAFIPSSWKAIGAEDPALGIPTTYYGAVQLAGTATVHDERLVPGSVAAILRRQLGTLQPDEAVPDPATAHPAKVLGILGIEIAVSEVTAKFKYGGNVDAAHRSAVVVRLETRGGPGDRAAAAHVVERLDREAARAD